MHPQSATVQSHVFPRPAEYATFRQGNRDASGGCEAQYRTIAASTPFAYICQRRRCVSDTLPRQEVAGKPGISFVQIILSLRCILESPDRDDVCGHSIVWRLNTSTSIRNSTRPYFAYSCTNGRARLSHRTLWRTEPRAGKGGVSQHIYVYSAHF